MSWRLDELRDKIASCTDCRACDEACSIYLATHDDSLSPWSRVDAARAILKGGRSVKDVLRQVYSCTCCGTCTPLCPMGVPIPDVVRALRARAAEEGAVPEPIAKLCRAVAEAGSMTGGGREFWEAWLPEAPRLPRVAESLYLAGCMVAARLHELGRATVEVLSMAGVDLAAMGREERCCGLLLYDHGMVDEARALAEANVSRIEERRPSRVLTACAACYWSYKQLYPRLYRRPSFEVVHVAEALAELVDEDKLRLNKRVEEKVMFLDPCHFTKALGSYEAPRKVLESVPGLRLVEPSRSRERGLCCGASGGIRLVAREASLAAAKLIVDEAVEAGASRIVTACPLCMFQLSRTAEERGLKVTDLPLLVKEAL